MKILQICGVVAGIHALVILVIFVNPGCSSAGKPDPNAASTGPTPPAPVDTGAPGAPAVTSSSVSAPEVTPASATNAFYAPTRPNSPVASVLEPAAPVADVTPAATYVVKSGDSMWLIAHHNHLKVAELAAANGLKPNAKLRSGQKLLIPNKAGAAPAPAPVAASALPAAGAPGEPAAAGAAAKPAAGVETKYTVKAGESLSAIAKRFGLTTGDLAAKNNITDPRKIRPGQELTIPAGHLAKPGAKKPRKATTVTPPETAAPTAPSAAETAPGPAATAPDAGAPGPETNPSVSVPIIKIDGADHSAAPSAAEPVPVK
jgi:LysM repeat protein